MLASWRGTRFEVVQVLREVCDRVLREPGVPDQVLYNRAKGLLLLGAVFKATVPDETDEERRELERYAIHDSMLRNTDVLMTCDIGWLQRLPLASQSTTPRALPPELVRRKVQALERRRRRRRLRVRHRLRVAPLDGWNGK